MDAGGTSTATTADWTRIWSAFSFLSLDITLFHDEIKAAVVPAKLSMTIDLITYLLG